MTQPRASSSSGSLLTTLLTRGTLGRSPFLRDPGQGSREPGMSLGSISDKLCDLSSLCLCFLIHPLSQSLLKACLPSTSQELYLSSSRILYSSSKSRLTGCGKSLNMQTGASAPGRTAPACPMLLLISPAAEKRAGIRPQRACAGWCGPSGPTLPPAG